MTSESLAPFGDCNPESPKVWRIYKSQHEVERELDLGEMLPFVQDLASLICAKTKQPLYKLTYRGHNREEARMRQYFVFFMRHHPYLLPWSTAEKSLTIRVQGLAFPKIGKLLSRDHSTASSAWQGSHRGLKWELERRPNGLYAYDLRWISDQLEKIDSEYGWLDVSPFLGRRKTTKAANIPVKFEQAVRA